MTEGAAKGPAPTPTKESVHPGATEKYGYLPTFVRAVPSQYPSPLPRHLRILAWTLALVIPSLFYIGPLMLTLPPFLYTVSPRAAAALLVVDVILAFYPARPWPRLRRTFQLWYEIFDFHHNVNLEASDFNNVDALLIQATHPHGIIPIHAFLWSAYCDQNFPNTYGFCAVTDGALRLPFLRHVLLWLSSKSTSRAVIESALDSGENLYIYPGGVAEIFHAYPGGHSVKARRRGLMRMALQKGAVVVPSYIFGGNDFYHQLATYGTGGGGKGRLERTESNVVGQVQEKISRRMKGGFTFFWGQYGLPMPFRVKCYMAMGDPIYPVPGTLGEGPMRGGRKTCRNIPNPTEEQIEELTNRYEQSLRRIFDQYKAQAGYPDAELEVT